MADRAGLSDAQCAAIAALARDFPRLWNDPHTPQRERKRMARLLIADVTLLKDKELRVQVRFAYFGSFAAVMPYRSWRQLILI